MNKSFEDMLIGKISSQQAEEHRRDKIEEKIRDFQAAYERAEKLLSEDRIDIDKFKGLYGADTIEEDKNYVARRQKEFEENDSPQDKEMRKFSVIAEAIIHDQIDMNDWLGESATAQKTSLFDDYKYGVDEFVRFKKTKTSPTAHLALGVDITFGKGIIDKMEIIKDHVRRGDLGKIKYLLTDKYRGELRNVPRAVIGFDMKNLQELKELWIDKKRKALAQHPVKFMIIEQMKLQLEAFAQYAQKVNQPAIADAFEEVLKILERINSEEIESYTGEIGDFDFESDRVYRTIKNYCAELNKD
jgi:hypothetical protein